MKRLYYSAFKPLRKILGLVEICSHQAAPRLIFTFLVVVSGVFNYGLRAFEVVRQQSISCVFRVYVKRVNSSCKYLKAFCSGDGM